MCVPLAPNIPGGQKRKNLLQTGVSECFMEEIGV